jgi:GTPase SAR1 family protein
MVKQEYDLLMKMTFVGDFGVGKTNLITRIASD